MSGGLADQHFSREKSSNLCLAMSDTVLSKKVLGQTLCASGAGIFQVYSGGIAIDTVSTRMQAGMPARQAIFGARLPSLSALYSANLFAGCALWARCRVPRFLHGPWCACAQLHAPQGRAFCRLCLDCSLEEATEYCRNSYARRFQLRRWYSSFRSRD